MFFWLIAIPFFVIIAMFTLFRLPSSDLHEPEDIQDTAMAFRMAMQHDAAAKLMQEYKATGESDMFDEGSYDLGGDEWKETILSSGYIPSSFIPDTDNITTYIRCLNGLRQITSCRGATGIYMVTAATPPSGSSITTRWFEKKGAENLASQLKKYEGSFPVKQSGLVLPKKPRKQEGESDEAFAIRLNEYKETKAQYKLLKRNYYDFGTNLPRPNTTAGQVRAYPFGEESAESRVIVQRIKAIEGDVVFDKEYMPTDLPSGGEGSDSMDFNGEAVIFTASGSCNEGPCACTKGTDCGTGVYCLSGTCSSGCGTYGFDANRTCYTTCTSDSQCPEGYFCDSGLCEETTRTCLTYLDCPTSKPYCNNGECSATQILTCDSTDTMATDTWIAGWANCTSCPAGQFKKYQSGRETSQCAYPVASTAGCVNIPALNSYTTMPTGIYHVGSYSTVSNANMWHRQVNITCNGKNEEWDLVGPFIEFWEAQEVCAKLGKKLPANTDVLTGGCTEGARWSLIANAPAVGTGQTLTAVSGISTTNSWNSSTGNTTSSGHFIYTNQDYGNSCFVWGVQLATGATNGDQRSHPFYTIYALCGPAN